MARIVKQPGEGRRQVAAMSGGGGADDYGAGRMAQQ